MVRFGRRGQNGAGTMGLVVPSARCRVRGTAQCRPIRRQRCLVVGDDHQRGDDAVKAGRQRGVFVEGLGDLVEAVEQFRWHASWHVGGRRWRASPDSVGTLVVGMLLVKLFAAAPRAAAVGWCPQPVSRLAVGQPGGVGLDAGEDTSILLLAGAGCPHGACPGSDPPLRSCRSCCSGDRMFSAEWRRSAL